MLPKPVHVAFPQDFEQMGIAISDDELDVGSIGTYVELYDIITIDGVRRQVVGIQTQARSPEHMGWEQSEGWDITVRLKHRAVADDLKPPA